MTVGFWKGLLHGGVVCVIGLGVLSVLVPGSAGPESSDTGAETVASRSDPEPEPPNNRPAKGRVEKVRDIDHDPSDRSSPFTTTDGSTQPDMTRKEDRPQAASVAVPSGSEFGRGSDAAPLYPEAMTPHSPETQPVALTGSPAADPLTSISRPPWERKPHADAMQPSVQPQSAVPATPDLPASQSAPVEIELPDLARIEAPDRLPDGFGANLTVAAPSQDDLSADGTARQSPPPALVMPSPDLSTPPDLLELRALERD